MKIGMQIILCILAAWLQMHPCLKGEFARDLGRCVFLASVARPPQLIKGFASARIFNNIHSTLTSVYTYGGM